MSTTIKRISIGIIMVIGIAVMFSTLAQTQPRHMSTGDRVKILKDSLKLNDEQSTKIAKILDDQRKEMVKAIKDNHDNGEAMEAARLEIVKNTSEQIKSVLTKDQAIKYDEMIKARRAQMEKRAPDSGK